MPTPPAQSIALAWPLEWLSLTKWVCFCFIVITIPKGEQIFVTKNVIVGFAEIVVLDDRKLLTWALPGGEETTDYDEAYEWAERTNHIIRFNLAKYSRSILNLN